jgi:hypothetical protein
MEAANSRRVRSVAALALAVLTAIACGVTAAASPAWAVGIGTAVAVLGLFVAAWPIYRVHHTSRSRTTKDDTDRPMRRG